MRKAVRLGLAAAVLVTATPAMASDFSGIGRFFQWGIAAIIVLIAIPVVLIARRRQPGSREGSACLAAATSIMFAPAIVYRDHDQWVPMPFPGSLVAMVDGSWAELWPAPLISMVVGAAGLFWLFERSNSARPDPDSAP